MILIGIDPGLSGAIAMLGHRAEYMNLADMPVMRRQRSSATVSNQANAAAIASLLREWTAPYDKQEIYAAIETPLAMPGLGVTTVGAAFHTAGVIEGVLGALGIRAQLARPSEWKRALGLIVPTPGKRAKLTQHEKAKRSKEGKERAREAAIRAWPEAPLGRVKDHNRAEALLIAKYAHGLVA